MTFYKMNELIMFKLSTKVSVEKPLSPSAKCFASSRTLIQTKKKRPHCYSRTYARACLRRQNLRAEHAILAAQNVRSEKIYLSANLKEADRASSDSVRPERTIRR